MKSLIAAVLIACLVNEVAGSGVAWLRFITYNNPRGKGNNGHCCDGRSFFCERRGCDHYFKICLDRSGGSDSIVDCSVAEVSTGSVTDRDRITFGESIGSTANPITLPFEQWQSNGRLKIEVWDHDGRSSDDFVDRLSIRLSQTPASSLDSAPITRLDMIARTTLVLELKVACDVNWYGTGCDVYCRPRDDHLGHYDCHRDTGVKLCVEGWGGSDCNRNIDECQSSPCQNEARCVDILNGYMCVCADGFEGIYCEANIDDCQAEQCLNGATCLDGVAQFTCACAEGFTGHLCETNIDECLSSPCEHDSTCQDVINGFQCTCSDGFVGERCQTEVDECLSQPCLNGGLCQDMIASYNCSCISGFTGTQCEIDINECSSDPCHGELSECVDQVNGFQCICPLHRRGPACAIVINWCDSSPCHNNATCESFHDSFTCTCPSGWAGALCSEDVNECASSPCHYNQTCLDLVDGYLCNCSASYTGLNCEVDVDECALDYCQNNATCENSVGSYECLCSVDWFGQNCESMVNYCHSEPCQNNATCVPVVGGVECQCQPGWTGHLCEANIDDCASQPCQEGATCHDLIGGYTCTCAAGWIGQNCSSEVDECASNPCLNGGTCTDWPGSYSCSCPLGYTGSECQTEHACWSAPCQNGGTCIERVDNGTDYQNENKTGECYECKCDVGVMGLNCEDVIFLIVNGTITFPSFTKKDEYEHSGILLTRTVTDKEAAMMVTKLKEPLANFLQLRSDDFTMGYRNSRCHGFNDSEEIGILVFWAEVKRVPIPWTVIDLALDDTQQLEQLLGVPVYEGEGCAPVVDKVEMATPEWYTSYWFMSVVGGLVLLVLAIIVIVGVTRRRKKPRDGARLLNINPLYDFKRVPTPMENIINSDVNSVDQNGLYSSEEGIGNPAYQEVGVNGIYDVPRRLNESVETKTEQLIE